MPKQKLDTRPGTPGLLPFLEDALVQGSALVGMFYEVTSVSESRKRSGWLLKTAVFQVFVWKSDPICEVLIETLEYLTKKNPGCSLSISPSNDSVEGFELATDDEETRLWTKTKKLRVLDAYLSRQILDTPEATKRIKSK